MIELTPDEHKILVDAIQDSATVVHKGQKDMNERIKQLAEQMGWEEMGADLYGKSMDGCMTIHALEKFAQLIVRECAALAKSKSEHIEGIKTKDPDDQMLLRSLAWQFKEFSYVIEKHFGVKQ